MRISENKNKEIIRSIHLYLEPSVTYLFKWIRKCTNEILISDANSDKNSFAIIYICLKMYCLKYVVNLILFLFYFYLCGPGVAI